MTKNIKKNLTFIVCILMLFQLIFYDVFMAASYAAESSDLGTSGKIDVVVVIDDTKSMQRTDPGRLAAQAIKMFSAKFPTTGNQTGVCAYSIAVAEETLPLGNYSPEELCSYADNKLTQNGSGTDAAAGLRWAVSQLESNGQADSVKAVILVGDGKNEVNVYGRTQEASDKDLNDSISIAQTKGIKVFALAINPEDQSFRDYFANIAEKTGGTAYEPATAEKVKENMDMIFEILQGETGINSNSGEIDAKKDKVTQQDIDVPTGVFEMVVQLEHQQAVELSFIDPNGNIYDATSKELNLYQEDSFTNCRVFKPISGTWIIKLKSSIDQKIPYDLIYQTEISLDLYSSTKDVMAMSPVQYSAVMRSKGEDITDSYILDKVTVDLEVKDKSNESVITVPMTLEDSKYVNEFTFEKEGSYEVTAVWYNSEGSAVRSNTIMLNGITTNPDYTPLWKKIVVAVIVLIVIALVIILFIYLRVRPGSGYVPGNVRIQIQGITVRNNIESNHTFGSLEFRADTIFEKSNSLEGLIDAYKNRIRADLVGQKDAFDLFLANEQYNRLCDAAKRINISGTKSGECKLRAKRSTEDVDIKIDQAELKTSYNMSLTNDSYVIEFGIGGITTYKINLTFSGI